MEILIRKLKENNYKVFKIKDVAILEIIDSDNFVQAQDGFRFNPIKNKPIKEWNELIGENFYVVGFETSLGDVIIADAGTKGFPIYFMMHDDWDSIMKVANSFNEFIENLKQIENAVNVENQDKEVIQKLVEKLDNENGANDFYEDLCYDILKEDNV